MSNIKWGDTHCPVCEKKFAQDADYDEGYRLEQTYGVDSQPVQEFDARLCWADCYDFDTILKRLGELLTERDMLRAALTIYGERQNWHYERWPSEYVHPNELNLYSWVGDGFRAPWQLANKVLEKDGDA